MGKMTSRKIVLSDIDPRLVFGQHDAYLRIIESQFGVKIISRGQDLTVEGEPSEVDQVEKVIADLVTRIKGNQEVNERYLLYAIAMVKENGAGPADQLQLNALITSLSKEPVQPKTVGQKAYVQAMVQFDIVFSIGPAGTGKTYLAVAMAVAELKKKMVNRVILVRPAVEAGESLGFLPGDIRAKVDPYLRPVYDALHDLLPGEKIRKLIEAGIIEIVPLAFMRGRTLNSAFVILDEAQNTTNAQMKMFLTRLGNNSKAVITGDITQIDLDDKKASGLVQIQKILTGIPGIKFVYLTEKDVVRHRLVQDIILAYERYENKKSQ